MADSARPRPRGPTRERSSGYNKTPGQRTRDVESGTAYRRSPPTPTSRADDSDPIIAHTSAQELGRKKSLIRPERNRINKDHPNYHYRQHAAKMEVYPSTTGNDLILEDIEDDGPDSTENTNLKEGARNDLAGGARKPRVLEKSEPIGRKHTQRKPVRKDTKVGLTDEEKRRQKELDKIRPPSVWNVYCSIVTFWAPGFLLKCFGMPAKAQRRAWREKVGLISLILLIAAFVGFLTFGFTQAVCLAPGLRLQINEVDRGYMIFHGEAYNLGYSQHPAAPGIPLGSNVLYDLPHKYGGQDGSFMFQNVNGACKDLITLAPGSDVPTDSQGNLAWYFPCVALNQDGSSKPGDNGTTYEADYSLGYACHTTANARETFYGKLTKSGDVFFTWDDIKNSSRNLMVYSGSVVDLDRIEWFNKSQVAYPAQFDELRANPEVRGIDMTHILQSGADRKVGKCLTEIMKVGSIDTESVGCIASKVVLYVSLVFILSIVLVKFLLALLFQWFLSRKYGAAKTSQSSDPKKRAKQIEEWSDDIYKQAPRITDPASTVTGSDGRTSKRSTALFPQTSRFTSPYAVDRTSKAGRPQPTTMISQSSAARLLSQGPYGHAYNASQGTLEVPGSRFSLAASRSSLMLSPENRYSTALAEMENGGPEGFIHENVVPQPPPEWQPFGYPLAHTMCLVTAYSEGADGIRTRRMFLK